MPEHNDVKETGVLNPETHHETSDVDVRGILWFVVIFLVFAVVTHVVLYFLYAAFRREFRADIQPARTSIKVPAQMPQTPRLQPFPQKDQNGRPIAPNASTPVVDMVEMRAAEDEALKNPGWVDKEKGIVRIPIERAKQLVVQRGGKL
jgi:hypothetical protein